MSLFLGPIHTWLYDKVKFQDSLTRAIADMALEKGYATEEIKTLDTSLATLEEGNLEEIVNGSIHEWLLERVGLVELRLAYVLSSILKEDASHIDEIEKVAYEFGAKQACESGVSVRFALIKGLLSKSGIEFRVLDSHKYELVCLEG